jgi:tungstate transport system substrate-binding protein
VQPRTPINKAVSVLPAVVLTQCLCAAACLSAPQHHRIALATTTSVNNSGLLEVVLPAFRSQTGTDVQLVTPGSGIALDMLARADVDVVITHAPAREAEQMARRTWRYQKIMFNDFVIVGPPDDPAHVLRVPTADVAMRRIAASGVRFISRGDSSGTHEREQELWARAGITPNPAQVVVAGSGMGATLRIAGTMRAYTLTDRATFSQQAERGDLRIVFDGDPTLLNTYAVIVPNEASPDALKFTDWLVRGDGRRLIAEYRVAGAHAFTVWPPDCPGDVPSALPCADHAGRRSPVPAVNPGNR